MPRNSRFENKRVARLLGHRIKPIFKPIDPTVFRSKLKISQQSMNQQRFDSSNYLTLHKYNPNEKTVLKKIYRIYRDPQVFDNLQCSQKMRGIYSRDSQSPAEHIKSDSDYMWKCLKQAIDNQSLKQEPFANEDDIYEEEQNIEQNNPIDNRHQ